MLLKALLTVTTLASAAVAMALNPGPGPSSHLGSRSNLGPGGPNTLSSQGHCLYQADADKLTDAYLRMIGGWNDADAKYLSDSGFKDTSDSINILAGVPLGAVVFPTKQSFIDHQHVAVRSPLSPLLFTLRHFCVVFLLPNLDTISLPPGKLGSQRPINTVRVN